MSQSSKRRFCPAVRREITSQECGEHRNSKYQCPAICQFNPFAPSNYSHLLELERQLDKVMFKALVSEPFHGDQVQPRFLANGGNYDPAWLAAALGQHDLCLPPPPPRPRLEVAGSSELEPEAEESPSNLPPAPPLPLHLDADVAERRINDAVKAFPNFLDLQEAAVEAGCTWVDDVEQMTGSKLSDKEFEAVAVALIESWFAMVPVGFSGPEISLDRITARLERISNKLREHDQAEILPSSLKSEFQCHIGGMAILTFLDLCKDSKR